MFLGKQKRSVSCYLNYTSMRLVEELCTGPCTGLWTGKKWWRLLAAVFAWSSAKSCPFTVETWFPFEYRRLSTMYWHQSYRHRHDSSWKLLTWRTIPVVHQKCFGIMPHTPGAFPVGSATTTTTTKTTTTNARFVVTGRDTPVLLRDEQDCTVVVFRVDQLCLSLGNRTNSSAVLQQQQQLETPDVWWQATTYAHIKNWSALSRRTPKSQLRNVALLETGGN